MVDYFYTHHFIFLNDLMNNKRPHDVATIFLFGRKTASIILVNLNGGPKENQTPI